MDTGKRFVPLERLFKGFPLEYSPREISETSINGIEIDSRKVRPGDLFIARKGGTQDGHDFIGKAIDLGAAAIVGEKGIQDLAVPYIRVSDSIQAVSWLAAAYHDWPGSKLTVIGVTGTDGKTTTCNLIHQILKTAGLRAGLISTVNAVIGDEILDTGFHVTTPDAHEVQYYLAKMAAAGLTHVVLETTSHGLAQHRVDACQYDAAVFTNITHEHLDQHGTYENYRAEKGRLLDLLNSTGKKAQGILRLAILNKDDASYDFLHNLTKRNPNLKEVNYGITNAADIKADNIVLKPEGIQFDAVGEEINVKVISSLVGAFNVSNILAAMTVSLLGLEIEPETVVKGIAAMKGIPGRMERIDFGQSFTAMVDFAHTPNALRAALMSAREEVAEGDPNNGIKDSRRLIAVFGSAGLRDKEKRRMMAETSVELADVSIFTAEDPRTESLQGILDEMRRGAHSKGGWEGKNFHCILDRGDAILLACQIAKPGDIVMVCGKGHEQSMCFGELEYPWDDRTAVRAALARVLHIEGPAMPQLPTQDTMHG